MSAERLGLIAIQTPVALFYPKILKPEAYMENGKAKGDPFYSANFLIPKNHPDIPRLKAEMKAVAQDKWPGRALSELEYPLKDGDAWADAASKPGSRDFARGHYVFAATTSADFPPRVTDARTGFGEVQDAKLVYNGVMVVFEVRLKPRQPSRSTPDGIKAFLQRVCLVEDGPRLPVGGARDEDVFQGVAGRATTESFMGNDDIPF